MTNITTKKGIRMGSVIMLPCEIGDTVWRVEEDWRWDGESKSMQTHGMQVVQYVVRSFSIYCNSKGTWTKTFRICKVVGGKTIDVQRNIDFDQIGVRVFFNKDQAEMVSAEMQAKRSTNK